MKTISLEGKEAFLTVQEVSRLLKIGELTIYKYIRKGQIEAIQLGGHYRIDKLSLEKFLDNHKVIKEQV